MTNTFLRDDATFAAVSFTVAGASDYAEGTWTPTLNGNPTVGTTTYTTQIGSYEKIGRFISARFNIQISGISGAGTAMTLGGLPFTNSAEFGYITVPFFQNISLTAGFTTISGVMNGGANFAFLYETSATGTQQLPATTISATARLLGYAIYRI